MEKTPIFKKLLFTVLGLMALQHVSFAQLSGTKTINPAGSGPNNYNTFAAAITDLNFQGVGPGGVTFNVSPNVVFFEKLPVITATGTATKPIVFRKNGSGNNPVVAPNVGGNKGATSMTVGNFYDGIIQIYGGDYITFDGIDVRDYGQFADPVGKYEYGYFLMRKATDASKKVTIKNCVIRLDSSHKYTIGIYQSKYDTSGTAVTVSNFSGSCDSNYYIGNTTMWCRSGMRFTGQATAAVYDGYTHVEGNTIYQFGGTNTTNYGIYSIYQSSTQIKNNYLISDSSHTTTLYGIYLTTATNASNEVQYNRVTIRVASGSGSMYCYYISSGSSGVNNSNRIHHNRLVQCNTGTGTGTLYCFYLTASTAMLELHNNTVDSITRGGSGSTYGTYISAAKDALVYQNTIKGIRNTSTGTIYGMYLLSSMKNAVYNNQVSELYTNSNSADGLRGIYISSGSWKLYNNTVYLDAQSTGTSFGSQALYVTITANVEIANNIFVNRSVPGSSGYTVAYKRSGYSFTKMSDNSDRNVYYAGTPGTRNLIYQDGTYNAQTMNEYKSIPTLAPKDGFSVADNVPFINTTTAPYNLRISTSTPTQVEALARPITSPSITTDFDGNTRNATRPDAGAFEGNYTRNDITPPGIGYSPVSHTSLTSNRTVSGVQIKDISGVNVSASFKPRLYYRKKTNANTYAGNTSSDNGWKYVIANNNLSPFNFTIDYSRLLGGSAAMGDTIEYFIIAQDSAATANVAYNRATLASTPTSVNLAAANFPATGGLNYYVIKTGIAGNINVGTGQTYTTLTGAGGLFDAINNKVLSGNVTVSITSNITEPGTYALNEFSTDDPSYSISIVPSSATNYMISGRYVGGLIRFYRADRVTIDGRFGGSGNYLSFRNDTSAAATAVLQLIGIDTLGGNGCTDFTIRNITVIGGNRRVTTSYGILIGNKTVSTTGGVENDRIRIINNNIQRSYFALAVRGDISLGASDSIQILDNNIGSNDSAFYNGFRGIYMGDASGCLVQGNRVYNVRQDGSVSTTPAGIEIGTDATDIMVRNNIVYNIISTSSSTSAGVMGILLAGGENNILYNNLVHNIKTFTYSTTSTSANPFGIRITSGTGHKLYYNSVYLADSTGGTSTTAGLSAALVVTSTSVAELDIRNNIFANSMRRKNAGSKSYAVWFPASYDFSESIIDNNAYFVPATNKPTTSFFVGKEGTTAEYVNRNSWRSFTDQDALSQPRLNQEAGFINDSTLIIPDGILSPAESTGTPINDLGNPNKDFSGNDRPKGTGIAPDLGAYEFEGIPSDFFAPVIDSIKLNLTGGQCVQTARTVSAYVSDLGGTGTDTIWINYAVNGVPQSRIRMSLVSGTPANGVWQGTIPAAPGRNQPVIYNVVARDTAENFSLPSGDSMYKDAYLIVNAGPDKTINQNTKTTLIATKNFPGTITWTPGSITGDTLVTPILTTTTTFYATLSDGVCSTTDSAIVTAVTPVVPDADFEADFVLVQTQQDVKLSDKSLNIPDFWKWSISPSNYQFTQGTTDSSKNPVVSFSREGKYTVKLVASNAAGADSVVKTEYIEVYRSYCPIFSVDPAGKDNITEVTLDKLHWVDTTSRQFSSYIDFTQVDSNVTTTLTRNRSYTLTIKNGGTRAGTLAAFIDYNLNGMFDDAGEKLGELTNVLSGDKANLAFSTPANLDEGSTRIRIRLIYANSNIQPCANYADGEETYDFLVRLCNLTAEPLTTESTFCGGDSVVADAKNPGSTYTWSTGETTQEITLRSSGSYSLEVSNGYCSILDTTKIVVKEGFTGTAIAPSAGFNGKPGNGSIIIPDTVCAGNTLKFEVNPPAAYGNNGFGAQWFYYNNPAMTSNNGAVAGSLVSNPPFNGNNGSLSFTPALADGDSLIVITLNMLNLVSGCDSMMVRYIKVLPVNIPALGKDTGICPGASVTLDAGPAQSYQWSTGSSSQSIQVSTPGTYKVSIVNTAGCAASDSILVYSLPQPNPSFSYINNGNNTVTFNPVTTTGSSYLWNFGDGNTSTLTSPVHAFTSSGNFTIRLRVTTTSTGCIDSSLQVLNFTKVGIDESAVKDKQILVYPNPFNEKTRVRFTLLTSADVSIAVYDVAGKLLQTVSEGKLPQGEHEFGLGEDLPVAGIYFIKVRVNNTVSSVRIVKTN